MSVERSKRDELIALLQLCIKALRSDEPLSSTLCRDLFEAAEDLEELYEYLSEIGEDSEELRDSEAAEAAGEKDD